MVSSRLWLFSAVECSPLSAFEGTCPLKRLAVFLGKNSGIIGGAEEWVRSLGFVVAEGGELLSIIYESIRSASPDKRGALLWCLLSEPRMGVVLSESSDEYSTTSLWKRGRLGATHLLGTLKSLSWDVYARVKGGG